MSNILNSCDVLDLSVRQTNISRINIHKITNIIMNVDLIQKSTFLYVLSFNNCDISLIFSFKDKLISATYKFKGKSDKIIKSTLPYRVFNDLFSEFDRLNLKPIYNDKYIALDLEFNILFYYQKYQNCKGLSFQNKNEMTNIYIFGELIVTLNHKKKIASIEDTLLTDDFCKELYSLICNPIYNFNLQLNKIRNNKNNLVIDNYSDIKINQIILQIQEFFNNINQTKNLQTNENF